MKKGLKQTYLLLLCIIVLFTPGCRFGKKAEPITKSQYLLGTYCEITVFDKVDDSIIDKAYARVAEIEKKMTINNAEDSEIIELNDAAGKQAVEVSPDTFDVLEHGLYYSQLSNGRFDITIGPVVKLWNINTEKAAVPEQHELQNALKLVDYKKLILDKTNYTAKLEMPGMKVDLGGVAKGYAADEAAAVLVQNGVKHAIVNLGGNVLTVGSKLDGSDWRVGIQDPFALRGSYVGVVKIKNKAAVTSGVYERFFEKDGKIYHHIMDTATGFPADNELSSVTIIAPKASGGDGMSSATFLQGLQKGLEFIEKQEDREAIFITKDKKIYLTPGLKGNFELINEEFKMGN